MAKLGSTFILQMLFAFFTPCRLLEITSADVRSVHPGANITLHCNITDYYEISWYQMNPAGVRQIISATQSKPVRRYSVAHNSDESHYDATESNSSVGLVIIGAREADLGVYYCGGWNDPRDIQFGKFIRLYNLTADEISDVFSECFLRWLLRCNGQTHQAEGLVTHQFAPRTQCRKLCKTTSFGVKSALSVLVIRGLCYILLL
ncbi:uncharacterized protein DAT39_009788, partial [Clarias magur]